VYQEGSACGIGGGTASASFRNIINTKILIAVAPKAKQFPMIISVFDDGQVGPNTCSETIL
jgi:hypothetical protein